MAYDHIREAQTQPKEGSGASSSSLIALAEKWERLAASWMQVARDRNDDDPNMANRAQARAAIYQDCAEDLKANAEVCQPEGGKKL